MEHLLVIDYETDAERKRIDSAIERFRSKLEIHREKGVIIRLGGDDIEEFLQDLYARLEKGRENVRIYASEEYTSTIDEISETIVYETGIETESVRKFTRFLLNKMNASYEGVTNGIESYSVYTRKGRASIGTRFTTQDNGIKVVITITGFGNVVPFVANKIDEDLHTFLEESR